MTKARTLADNFAADINGITAGTGITGGGTSGTVTITNDMATAINAKGDLVVGTGADAYARLAVASTAGYLLSVDSAEATGLKWAAPAAGGGYTLLSSTTLSGTSTTISSIPQDYTHLFLFCNNASISANAGTFLYFNGDTTTANYQSNVITVDTSGIAGSVNNTSETFQFGTGTSWNTTGYFILNIPRYSVAEQHFAWGEARTSLAVDRTQRSNFIWNSASAITSIAFANGGGRTWSSGTVRLYGVK